MLAEVGLKLAQVGPSWPKWAPTEPQVGSKLAPCWPILGQVGPKLAPSWPHVGPMLAHADPSWSEMTQVGPKLAQRWPQVGPSWLMLAPNWLHDGPFPELSQRLGPLKGVPKGYPFKAKAFQNCPWRFAPYDFYESYWWLYSGMFYR